MGTTDRSNSDRARELAGRIAEFLTRYALWAFQAAKDLAPIVGRRAMQRNRNIVLAPYHRSYSLKLSILRLLSIPALAVVCSAYGFFFGLTAPAMIVACVVPTLVLISFSIWALPNQKKPPTLPIEILYPAFMVALVIWPNYVAISLPGLPWITMIRIIGLPMVACLLISLSVSPKFRRQTSESINSSPLLWACILAFTFIQLATLLASRSPGPSAQLVFNQQVYWTAVFVIGAAIFRDTKQVERYFYLLCALSIPIIALSIMEWKEQHVLWMNEIPPILRVPDPSIKNILTPNFRAGTNIYRVRATFSTPLEQAEFLSLLTPFFLHFGFYAKNSAIRVASLAFIPLIFFAVRLTDSRLGVVGMLVSILLYGVLWSIGRWRAHPKDLLAAATVYAYPALFVAAIGLVFASHSLRSMVLGGGAESSSNDARQTQLAMAFTAFKRAPWGFGAGQSGNEMGYAAGDFVAIDNYFIGLLLEYGALGVVAWYSTFIVAIAEATRHCLSGKYAGRPEARLLAPLAVALAAFVIIKWVHGSTYTHPIDFMLLGMVSALIYNLRNRSVPGGGTSPATGRALDPRSREPAPYSRLDLLGHQRG